ncbi:E3 ubiquitin-protein ligase TM129 [Diabrotica virgifera virgifera]|uniref:E3 ubiquitin-protein ligase TM129 n=1 Tax=Diabrotica virgifera virgifera TaxID=50390 RepID=A0ABM5K9I5_DIAVI|nr:E3 ubiquitin-protein ligase TM129 [Diabrotica virgifera virgifera]
MSSDFVFTVIYFLISICLIYPPTEFITAGVTIPNIFSFLLGNEHENFIGYHINKSCLYLIFYSVLPIGYLILSFFLGFNNVITDLSLSIPLLPSCFFTFAVILPIISVMEAWKWTTDRCERHPIVLNLTKFCNNNVNWKSVATNIDMEFRSIEKICLQTSAVVTVIVTENWIIKVSPLTMNIVHQSDASLVVKEADTFDLSPDNTTVQYLNIEVKSERQGVDPFIIRINASDFRDLKDKVARSIRILPNVKFHQTVVEKFVDVFNETIKLNPRYETNEISEQCNGCMQAQPNVKLQKLCEESPEVENKCTNCYCRPMWCSDCMAKWFASRQEADRVNTWLSSKCTCPMCRATFCMLDVCPLSGVQEGE